MIHACLEREWYVVEYLIPSMVAQGIPDENIEVWLDKNRDGNLLSCMKCFAECGKRSGGRWHLQDDVVIARDFRERTEQYDSGIVTGFFHREWQPLSPKFGDVPAVFMFNSFQCIRIPDEIAGGCAEWFFYDAMFRDAYEEAVRINKMDDSLFYDYVVEAHGYDHVYNLTPSLVDHVDYLIGGSVINKTRDHLARSDAWQDESVVDELKDKLRQRVP